MYRPEKEGKSGSRSKSNARSTSIKKNNPVFQFYDQLRVKCHLHSTGLEYGPFQTIYIDIAERM